MEAGQGWQVFRLTVKPTPDCLFPRRLTGLNLNHRFGADFSPPTTPIDTTVYDINFLEEPNDEN
jgi:hypothetical protein